MKGFPLFFWRRRAQQTSASSAQVLPRRPHPCMIGWFGQTIMPLETHGTVLIRGRLYEAMSQFGKIPAQATIEVVDYKLYRLVVRPWFHTRFASMGERPPWSGQPRDATLPFTSQADRGGANPSGRLPYRE